MDLDVYEAGLRRRSARNKLIGSIAGTLFLLMLLSWRGFLLFTSCSRPARQPPAAVVRVASDGSMRVDGCTAPVSACLASAWQQQQQVPGGGSYECLIVPAADATDDGTSAALRACFAAQLSPATMPRGAKW